MTRKPRPKWADYEALAHKILQELMPFAEVALDEKILGVESETSRQIDVAARWKLEGSEDEQLMIVQVKDYKRKADVNVIGEFIAVIQDTRATRGILICSGGFSRNAKKYARNRGIDLYGLADAQSLRWSEQLKIPMLWHRLTPRVNVGVSFYSEAGWSVDFKSGLFPPLSRDGGLTTVDLISEFEEAWNSGRTVYDTGRTHFFEIDQEGLVMQIFDSEGREMWRPVGSVPTTYTVTKESWLAHLIPSDYRGLIDHLDEDKKFIPSRVTVKIPDAPDDTTEPTGGIWTKVDDPDKLSIKVEGLMITMEQAEVTVGSSTVEDRQLRYLGPG